MLLVNDFVLGAGARAAGEGARVAAADAASGSEAAGSSSSAATAGTPFPWTEQQFPPGSADAPTRSCQLTQIPGEREHYELHSLRYEADPGRYVYVKIDAGLKSFGGYVLGDSVERIMPRAGISARAEHPAPGLAAVDVRREDAEPVRAQRAGDARRGRSPAAAPVAASGHADQRQLRARRSSTTGRSTPRTSPSASYEVAGAAAGAAGQGAVRSASISASIWTTDAGDRRGIFLLRVQAWDPDDRQRR